ncbi:hypothetical protein [Marinobacterium litorale]|uniref:hypothetical protein n=1 Tax=Marinobacterium litorale TaxID=404770 RepID=UPI0004269948|nr:hypothetical protein [Marinobacterium litorale]
MSQDSLNDTVNPLEMSDEELMAMEVPEDIPVPKAEESVDETGSEVSEEDTPAEEEEAADDGESDTDEQDTDQADPAAEEKPSDEPVTEEAAEPSDDDKGEEKETTPAFDYEAEYKKLIAPFKANGREMQIDNIDDARRLMQMGANYNKKMASLKPNLRLMKMLENNGLLDENKLSYLIDLEKKNPDAISKLIKDSGIDPLDVNTDKADEYNPGTYTVDENQMELDTVLDQIEHSPSYNETVDIISNKWDSESRKVIASNPQIIQVINEHVGNGIYAQINSVIERERMLGRLNGISDLAAYKQIGDRLEAEGRFNQPTPTATESIKKSVQAEEKPSKTPDPQINDRKRAAAPSKGKAPQSQPNDFNPLALSDDEFDKLVAPKFL